MNNPDIKIGCVANLFSRQMHFKNIGDIEEGHAHTFDHLTLLAHGALQVIIDGLPTIYHAPTMIYIKANINHKLISLAENTVAYCIHALRDRVTEDILSPDMIPLGSNHNDYSAPLCT